MTTYRVHNRYDQDQIIYQFGDFFNQYLINRKYVPIYRVVFAKIIIIIALIIAFCIGQYFKLRVTESKISLIAIIVSLIILVVIDKKYDIKNGILVGQYKRQTTILVYQLLYVPNTQVCIIVEFMDGMRREKQFLYNEYLDTQGNITQERFSNFINNFIGAEPSTENSDI